MTEPLIAPPIAPTPSPRRILPGLPERRAWPWAILLAFAHHALAGVLFYVFKESQELINFVFVGVIGVVPLALLIGIFLMILKRSLPGRVLMFGALFTCLLFVFEAGVVMAWAAYLLFNSKG